MGQFTATLKLVQKGGTVTGNISTDFGDAAVKNGTVSGNKISFMVALEAGGDTFEIKFTGTAEGDTASGTGDGPQGDFEWTARRTGGPGEEATR
ncbi:MAG: hypothetical protein ACE5HT_16655 [Gemmatimonadales bacterium]